MKTEEELTELLQKARKEGNKEVIAMFEKFGNNDRQRVMNYRGYYQWLECGYKGEPVFNEYGWYKNDIPDSAIEKIPLWHTDYTESHIEVAHLPNGKWVNGYNYMLQESGGCGGCSIWSTQYNSRVEAINAVLNRIKGQIQRGTNADKKHLADIKKVKLELMQPSLF